MCSRQINMYVMSVSVLLCNLEKLGLSVVENTEEVFKEKIKFLLAFFAVYLLK